MSNQIFVTVMGTDSLTGAVFTEFVIKKNMSVANVAEKDGLSILVERIVPGLDIAEEIVKLNKTFPKIRVIYKPND